MGAGPNHKTFSFHAETFLGSGERILGSQTRLAGTLRVHAVPWLLWSLQEHEVGYKSDLSFSVTPCKAAAKDILMLSAMQASRSV